MIQLIIYTAVVVLACIYINIHYDEYVSYAAFVKDETNAKGIKEEYDYSFLY